MKTCPQCDTPLEFDDSAFCTQCGARLAPPDPAEDVDVCDAPVEEAAAPADAEVERSESVGFEGERALSAGGAETTGAGAMSGTGEMGQGDLPLVFEFNQSVFLIDGCAGVMECRVRTCGGRQVEEVAVTLSSDALGEVAGATIPKLGPGRDRVVGLPITPGAVGTHHLTASVVYEHAGQVYAAVAFHRVTVLEQNASPASIQIHYENRVEASDNAVVSNRAGSLTGLDQMIASGRATVNDLLSQQAAPSWLALELEPDEALSRELRRRRREVVRPIRFHDAFAKPADRLGVISAGLMAADRAGRLSAQVAASLPLAFGRSQQSADVVLRVLPRNAEHDKASQMISGSRPHLLLRMDADGPILEDPGSANGTWVGGHRLEAPMPLDPHGPTRIDVAHVLSLQITPIAGDFEPQRYGRLGGQDALWRWGIAHHIAALRIEFLEPKGAEVHRPPVYVPVRWVDLVEDAHTGLTAVSHVGRAPAARIVRTCDGLWAEACIDGLTINQEPLPHATAAPIAPGDVLTSGGYSTRFDGFVQHLG